MSSPLSPRDLRAFAGRDWAAVHRWKLAGWGARSAEEKLLIGQQLWEEATRAHPDWPTEGDRDRDLESHRELAGKLRRARHVGAR